MKAVLISIQKEHNDNIFSGIKTIEWRKKPLPKGKYFVYESKTNGGCGKVIGEMEIVGNMYIDLILDMSPILIQQGCVSINFLTQYANGKQYLYANKMINVKRYSKPKELSEFRTICKTYNNFYDLEKCCDCKKALFDEDGAFYGCDMKITRPPQSWGYVEELTE